MVLLPLWLAVVTHHTFVSADDFFPPQEAARLTNISLQYCLDHTAKEARQNPRFIHNPASQQRSFQDFLRAHQISIVDDYWINDPHRIRPYWYIETSLPRKLAPNRAHLSFTIFWGSPLINSNCETGDIYFDRKGGKWSLDGSDSYLSKEGDKRDSLTTHPGSLAVIRAALDYCFGPPKKGALRFCGVSAELGGPDPKLAPLFKSMGVRLLTPSETPNLNRAKGFVCLEIQDFVWVNAKRARVVVHTSSPLNSEVLGESGTQLFLDLKRGKWVVDKVNTETESGE